MELRSNPPFLPILLGVGRAVDLGVTGGRVLLLMMLMIGATLYVSVICHVDKV